MTGLDVTFWTARAAAAGYAVAVLAMVASADSAAPRARRWWRAGCLVYLAHVVAAFAFVHDWSHDAALVATARQTAALTGVASGAGLYLNYLFTLVWAADAAWWTAAPAAYATRSRALVVVVHGFMAFMFVNATVVFGSVPMRVAGLVVLALTAGLWWHRRRAAGPAVAG